MNDDKKYQVMPDLTDEEYAELKADIAERGVMVPIEFDEYGNILDGYNRKKIADELGISYPTVIRAGLDDESKDELAYTLNLTRRHLSHDQKIQVARDMATRHPEWPIIKISKMVGIDQAELSVQLQDIVRLDRTIGADGKSRPANAEEAQAQREAIRTNISEHPEMSDRQIAREMGVSPTTVGKQREAVDHIVSVFNPSARDAEALKDPDIQRRLAEDDKMNVAGAIREQTRDNLIEHLESVETKEAKAVQGVYDVIVIDPPWPMSKIETDARPHATELDYPTMSIEEIKQMTIPAADDCHIFLWTTQKYLPDAFSILESWGVKYVCCFVWHKDNGYKPFGLPKYNCEFVLYGHIGSPKFIEETQFWACFDAPITAHSEKPDAFYDMIRRVTAGRRLDMFNRREIDGFDTWGKEAAG